MNFGIFLQVDEQADDGRDDLPGDGRDGGAFDLEPRQAEPAENQDRVEHDVDDRADQLRHHRELCPACGLQQPLEAELQQRCRTRRSGRSTHSPRRSPQSPRRVSARGRTDGTKTRRSARTARRCSRTGICPYWAARSTCSCCFAPSERESSALPATPAREAKAIIRFCSGTPATRHSMRFH